MRRPLLKTALLALLAVAAALWLVNTSWLAPTPTGEPRLVSHRGVHQMYDRRDLGRDDCTATRIHPPVHDFIENTLPSMQAAFAAGADIIELDVHPTRDGEFVVFHDWTVDCRSNGTGVTRQQTLEYLKSLDIGHGYTADGGATYPLRGTGIGMMPTLAEVYAAFPGREFLLNIKSNNPREAEWLAEYLERHELMVDGPPNVYGGEKPVARWQELFPAVRVPSRARVRECTKKYVLWGWSGWVPETCREGGILVPANRTWLYWGWPNRFIERMQKSETQILVMGNLEKGSGIAGVEHPGQLESLPSGFSGHIWVEAIETVGPFLHDRDAATPVN